MLKITYDLLTIRIKTKAVHKGQVFVLRQVNQRVFVLRQVNQRTRVFTIYLQTLTN